jgi:hypothetical protein
VVLCFINRVRNRDWLISVIQIISDLKSQVNSEDNGAARADEKGAFSFKINLTEGSNAISVVVYDMPGNASAPSAVMNVFLNTKPPENSLVLSIIFLTRKPL